MIIPQHLAFPEVESTANDLVDFLCAVKFPPDMESLAERKAVTKRALEVAGGGRCQKRCVDKSPWNYRAHQD